MNRISDDFERKAYYWDKPWGVKRYESIILSKFILDYSFEKFVQDELLEEEKISYYDISKKAFADIFNDEFSGILNY